MKIEIKCEQCTDVEEDGKYSHTVMNTIGPLTLSPENIQAQEYKCPRCGI